MLHGCILISSMASAFTFRPLDLCILLNVILIPLALALDKNQFIYNYFPENQLYLDGSARIHPNGLLQLTNISMQETGHAFYPFPLKFNTSSTQSLSFSTNFVFAIVPGPSDMAADGMAIVIAPSMDFSEAYASKYLGLFNSSNLGQSANHILAIELDTVQNPEFNDINGNHVGINLNSLISIASAPAGYFSDEGKNVSLDLQREKSIQIWIDYNGEEKLLNVTLAPITILKPNRPLLSTPLDLSQILLDSMYVGFSAATGDDGIASHYIRGWSFRKGGEAEKLSVSELPPVPLNNEANYLPTGMIIWLAAVYFALLAIIAACYFARNREGGNEEVCEDWEREYGPERFSYKNLYEATKGFEDKQVIGKGGFGKVYRGTLLSSNEQIAVKRISHDSEQGMKEFVAEIVSMKKLRHRNVVQLRGYCRLMGELLLVYDYMSNGSLDKILYSNGNHPNINWFQRFRILRGVACGLLYLHEDCEQVVLHRDIKPANVLLDNELNGKLGDFGLARLHSHGGSPETTKLVGTIGYMAPEIMRTGRASTSTDVYAFGVLMLEVACGRRPREPEKVSLIDWVSDCWKRGAIIDACDPRMEGLYAEEQLELILKLGLFCSHTNPEARPSMRQVMQYLDGEVMLPDIPLEGFVTDLITAVIEASYTETSVTGNNSAHTRSTVDSILAFGR